MRRFSTEENEILLNSNDDDTDEFNGSTSVRIDESPVVVKHTTSNNRRHSTSSHPVLWFSLILGSFIIGCMTGVFILLYRMSQDNVPSSSANTNSNSTSINVDLSVRTKLFQSIENFNFVNVTHSSESNDDLSAKTLFDQWQKLSPLLSNVNKFSYEIDLVKYSNGVNKLEIVDNKNNVILKLDRSSADNFVCLSSLIKNGSINGNAIYYVNYGREEDFAYLFEHRISLTSQKQSFVVMRRQSNVISSIEQIHQAIHYGFAGLILFDDIEQQQTPITYHRHSFFREWARYLMEKERSDFLEKTSVDQNHSITVLVVSYDDIQQIFSSFQTDSSQWLPTPLDWNNNRPVQLKIGGPLANFQVRLTGNYDEQKTSLPVVMSSIRGDIDPERFVMIGMRLGDRQQSRIITEIIRIFTLQIQNGWKPKRSILFCAWSGFDYHQYAVHRWLSDNSFVVERNLIAYIDIGNGILSNSTLNLHGSPLLEQIARDAADIVVSPLKHSHTCHHRTTTSTLADQQQSHHNHDRQRRDTDHEQQQICETHQLLDEWIRASRKQFQSNETFHIVQSIDADSTAALFQLTHGIPSLLVEMTDEQSLVNNGFYKRYSTTSSNQQISAEVYVAYTQFLTEIIRQFIDQPLIAFNLTIYADEIDRNLNEFLTEFKETFQNLAYHIGTQDAFVQPWNQLTKAMRKIQLRIDQTPLNDLNRIEIVNRQLIELDRLFLLKDALPGMNSPDKVFKHMLIGPAFGLSRSVAPFPLLSNIFYDIPADPPSELCDQSRIYSLKIKEQIQFINRTIQGFDGLIN